jgi:hypothetical protein
MRTNPRKGSGFYKSFLEKERDMKPGVGGYTNTTAHQWILWDQGQRLIPCHQDTEKDLRRIISMLQEHLDTLKELGGNKPAQREYANRHSFSIYELAHVIQSIEERISTRFRPKPALSQNVALAPKLG